MQNHVTEVLFQRTDFGSFGWINKVPGDLWEVPFYSGIASLARSFRSKKSPVPFFQLYATQPMSFGLDWLFPYRPAIELLLGSFRAGKRADAFSRFYMTQPNTTQPFVTVIVAAEAAKTWLKRHLKAFLIIFKEEECL